MNWILWLVIGFLAGICMSELGWVKWLTCLVRKDCKDGCRNADKGTGK